MPHVPPDIADQLEAQLLEFDELSIDDVQRKMQWVWRQMIAATRDVEALERQLLAGHADLDPKWDEAYERSMLSQDKRLNARFHESVANNHCREELAIVAGLEAQKRIAARWLATLDKIHHGLQSHGANIRTLGAA